MLHGMQYIFDIPSSWKTKQDITLNTETEEVEKQGNDLRLSDAVSTLHSEPSMLEDLLQCWAVYWHSVQH